MDQRADRRNEIDRRRLLDQLADRFSLQEAVIEAGPGFGKSTLLRQVAAERVDVGSAGGRIDTTVAIPKRGAGRRDFVAALIELSDILPTNGRLLVAMRPDTRGRFSRLLTCGSVLVLRDEDLAFDLDERLSFSTLHGSSMAIGRHSGWSALLELEVRTGRTGALRYVISGPGHAVTGASIRLVAVSFGIELCSSG